MLINTVIVLYHVTVITTITLLIAGCVGPFLLLSVTAAGHNLEGCRPVGVVQIESLSRLDLGAVEVRVPSFGTRPRAFGAVLEGGLVGRREQDDEVEDDEHDQEHHEEQLVGDHAYVMPLHAVDRGGGGGGEVVVEAVLQEVLDSLEGRHGAVLVVV